MAKSAKEKFPIVYRLMCEKVNSNGYHVDFNSKDEAIKYAEELDDPKISWYGIYEIDPALPYLQYVTDKRLIPHDDAPKYIKKEEPNNIKHLTKKKRPKI